MPDDAIILREFAAIRRSMAIIEAVLERRSNNGAFPETTDPLDLAVTALRQECRDRDFLVIHYREDHYVRERDGAVLIGRSYKAFRKRRQDGLSRIPSELIDGKTFYKLKDLARFKIGVAPGALVEDDGDTPL